MSFASESRERSKPELPLSAMVDILFLLLVFFMTVSVFRENERQIDVSLPATDSAESASSKTQIIITITSDGGIFIGDRAYNFESLRTTLTRLAEQFPDESVVIRGDKTSQFGLAVRVLDTAYSCGLRNVNIATTKAQSDL